MLMFALVFLWWGIEFTRFAFNRISELAELPLWISTSPGRSPGRPGCCSSASRCGTTCASLPGKLPPPAARPTDEVPGSIT